MSEMKFQHLADAGLGPISAVVTSLPLGYTLGMAREFDRNDYILAFNAGNSEIPAGGVASPILGGAGVYSVTVSTASQGNDHIGGVAVQHTTVPTAAYFWGCRRGVISGMIGDSTVSIPTGNFLAVGDNGTVGLMPQSLVTGKVVMGVVLTTISNGGARTGNAYVMFS